MRTLKTAIATAAFILAPFVAHATEAAAPAPKGAVCERKTTITTDDAGRTVIRTKTTCTIEGSK